MAGKTLPLAVMLLAVVLAPGLLAQEGDAAKAAEAGKQLLAGVKEIDTSFLATTWYGIHMSGAKNVGKAKMVAEKAPDGSGAVYKVVTEIQMSIGPMTFKVNDVSLLDMAGSALSIETVEERSGGRETTSVKRTGDNWTGKVTVDGKSLTSNHSGAVTNHWDVPNHCFVVRKLPLDKPGVYILKGIDWPKPVESEESAATDATQTLPADCIKDVTFTVGTPVQIKHRGADIQVWEVKVDRPGEESSVYTVDAKHQILVIAPAGPIKMILGTEAEAGADLAVSEEDRAKEAGIREAIGVFWDVMATVKPVDALDTIMDWQSIQDAMAAGAPDVGALKLEAFVKMMKEQYGATANESMKESLEFLKNAITVKFEGETAVVAMLGGDENPFHLKKVDGKWKITRVPM